MLDLLKNFEFSFNSILWIILLSLLALSFLICLGLCARRTYRNNKNNNKLKEQSKFEISLNRALQENSDVIHKSQYTFKKTIIINEILLRYFRTLKGKRADTLRRIIKSLQIEKHIQNATKTGTMGRRMEAMQILSYLDSQASLQTIHQGLYAPNKYIRLTAARCLIRRQADVFVDNVVMSLDSAFPDDPQILADILYRFGARITPQLESYIRSSQNDNIKTACIEALVLLMPPTTSLELDTLMDSSNERVRAATVSLSEVTSNQSKDDILIRALADPATKVKIRAAKIAYSSKRSDTISLLFKLTKDPILWVRYWSTLAIWNTGRQGRKLVETIAKGDDSAARMAREVALECTLAIQGAVK